MKEWGFNVEWKKNWGEVFILWKTKHMSTHVVIQWGSKYPTSSVFKCLKRGWMPNGLVFEHWTKGCHLVFICTGWYSNGQSRTSHINWTIWNPDFFVWISNSVWQNGGHLSGFQMVGLPDFRSHSKSRPFATQPLLNHLKSRLGRISDSHCTIQVLN